MNYLLIAVEAAVAVKVTVVGLVKSITVGPATFILIQMYIHYRLKC
jgi:hypothetical protein